MLFQEHCLRGGKARSRFEGISRPGEARLDRAHGGEDVVPADDSHVADAEVFVPDLREEASGEDDTCLPDEGKNGAGHPVRKVGGGQGMGRLVGADRYLFHPQGGHGRLEGVAHEAVAGEPLFHTLSHDLRETDIEGPDDIDGLRPEVGRLAGLEGFHDGEPVCPV